MGVILGTTGTARGTAPIEVLLWPEGRMSQLGEPEKIIDNSKDPAKPFRTIFNVSIPSITVYRPTSTNLSIPAVVICPGGCYVGLAIDHEGHDVARWLNSLGIAGVVLKYRVPTRNGDGQHLLPLQDVQRAISWVRFRAKEWNLDPKKIGIMGFSAGGHLAAHVSNNYKLRAYESGEDMDRLSCRPDFSILVYPAYLAKNGTGPVLNSEFKVTTNTPPAFLVQTEDDMISVENSLFYYLALKKVQVPAYMVLYPKGGHGYGLGVQGGAVASWPQHCESWMRDRGILKSKEGNGM
jgi:acetyl esterase/lipase